MARTRGQEAPDGDAVEAMIAALLEERPQERYGSFYGLKLEALQAGKAILAQDRDVQVRLVASLVRRVREFDRKLEEMERESDARNRNSWREASEPRQLVEVALRGLLRRQLPLGPRVVADLLDWIGEAGELLSPFWYPLSGEAGATEALAAAGPLNEVVRKALHKAVRRLRPEGHIAEFRKAADRLEALASEGPTVQLTPGEAWSDAALSDLEGMPPGPRGAWVALLASCQKAGSGKATAKWLKEARALRDADAEPVPLERVPPLVLSEILRDVDLFVGVASVGNDPTWADGGPDGRHADYWSHYSFGDLSANGQTSRGVLERPIPRLKIAGRCSLTDRFLVVRGDLRTYKIHLGSGNILMEPNDQYLCIVPKRSASEPAGGVFLPFEGDNTLSIILSKALLLAEDTKITDQRIVSQIKR